MLQRKNHNEIPEFLNSRTMWSNKVVLVRPGESNNISQGKGKRAHKQGTAKTFNLRVQLIYIVFKLCYSTLCCSSLAELQNTLTISSYNNFWFWTDVVSA